MRSYTITLFSKPPQRESAPAAYVVSMVVHSCLAMILLMSVKRVTLVQPKPPDIKDEVRLLDVRQALENLHSKPPVPPVVHHIAHHSLRAARQAPSPGGKLALARITRIAHLSTSFQTSHPAPQTLIQTQVHQDVQLKTRIPVAQAVVWTTGQILQEKIVTPEPKPLGDIEVKPSLAMPNKELTPAEISLTSTPFETKAPLPDPGTTSPVDIAAAKPAQQALETASKEVGQVSPARVISLSDMKLQNGEAILPVINEVAASNGGGALTLQEPSVVTDGGLDDTSSKLNGSGSGRGAGKGSGNTFGVTIADEANPGKGNHSDKGITVADDATPGVNTGGAGYTVDLGVPNTLSPDQYVQRHIQLPRTGQYGMVIVGASPQENYTETANLWTGRLVYTVYLQSETTQNWILQYSLPKSTGDSGGGIRPDAPWAYDMMRPNLGALHGVVLVHGFIDENGHFQKLAVAYPPQYSKTVLLLRALKQWDFRPAMTQGVPITVEILLIIPETTS